jgi:hypothetical protein
MKQTTSHATIVPSRSSKSNLARLLSRPVAGIFIAEYEHGDVG